MQPGELLLFFWFAFVVFVSGDVDSDTCMAYSSQSARNFKEGRNRNKLKADVASTTSISVITITITQTISPTCIGHIRYCIVNGKNSWD